VDLVMYLLIFGLIGARIFHVVSDFHLYKNNLLGMFAIWNGGLGFYGGLIGGLIAAYVYSKKHKINMMQILDVISVPMPFIIAFGRIANFMNSEHIGLPANHALCVVYQKIDEVCRHPAQLYESASMFILFGIMLYFSKKKKNPGFLFWSFIIGYGILRIFTDFYRSDYSIFFLGLSHTQIISILMLGISFYFIRKTKK
ncbi:MAG: prolipoprotein diacylglyceryl transferase, partial [Nanoarchaeota archaeon]